MSAIVPHFDVSEEERQERRTGITKIGADWRNVEEVVGTNELVGTSKVSELVSDLEIKVSAIGPIVPHFGDNFVSEEDRSAGITKIGVPWRNVEEVVETNELVGTSKVSEPKLVSESVKINRLRFPVLGLICSFVIKERRSCTVGSEGGQVHLKSTGVTLTLPEDAVSEETNVLVSSYLPEDYTETPAITCVTAVLPHGLTLRKKATIKLRHHLCLEKPFRVRILYHSGLPTCDEGYQLLADLNQGTPSFVDGETEVRVDRNCIRILCRGFSEYCTIQEGHFYISVRLYAPLAFTEGESEGNVVASLSCQCEEVTKKMDKDQRELTDEPKICKYIHSDYISVDSTEKVELSVDPLQGGSAFYSVSGSSSYTISAIALKSLIGEDHMKCITRPFFLERTKESSKNISINVSYKTFDKTGSIVRSFSFYTVMWRSMPRPGNLALLSNGRSDTPNGARLQDYVSDTEVNAVVSQSAGDWLDEVASPDELHDVAKSIGRHWRHVGGALGPDPKFEPTELDSFEAKSSDRNRAQEMLNTWAQKHHKNATRRMLILALKKENQNVLISNVFKCDPDSVTA